jgi:hypothetical protein
MVIGYWLLGNWLLVVWLLVIRKLVTGCREDCRVNRRMDTLSFTLRHTLQPVTNFLITSNQFPNNQ